MTMQVPAFLLRRLYVKGSLRNTPGGFEFDLMNTLGSGYAEQVMPLTINGEEIPTASSAFVVDGVATPFDEVSSGQPMTLGLNRAVTIAVAGRTLAPGQYRIGLGFVVTGMGEMQFEVTDAIEDGTSDG